MGIHTGEGAISAGEYTGVAIHRAARICSACTGGEILLSQVTSALLEDEEHESETFVLVDLGEQQLKDFERPVRVFRLLDAVPSEPVPAGRETTAASAC